MSKKEVRKPEIGFVVIHVVIMLFMSVLGIVCAVNVRKIIDYYNLYSNATYVQEYATIVKYKEVIHNTYHDFSTYYEYVSPDGTIYTGLHEARIKTEEEAKAQIGKKIIIYVDHELKLQEKEFTLGGAWFNGAMSTICFGLFLNSFIREILNIKRWRRYKRTPIEPEENEGDEWNE